MNEQFKCLVVDRICWRMSHALSTNIGVRIRKLWFSLPRWRYNASNLICVSMISSNHSVFDLDFLSLLQVFRHTATFVIDCKNVVLEWERPVIHLWAPIPKTLPTEVIDSFHISDHVGVGSLMFYPYLMMAFHLKQSSTSKHSHIFKSHKAGLHLSNTIHSNFSTLNFPHSFSDTLSLHFNTFLL